MMNFQNWNQQDLKGEWMISLKVDGMQIRKVEDPNGEYNSIKGSSRYNYVTKGGKPVYNLPVFINKFDVAEIFCGSWNETMSIARASKSERRRIKRSEIYPLLPNIDKRLIIGTFTNPDAQLIQIAFNQAVAWEYEGLVLRQGDIFIKVKPSFTEDVRIIGFVEGKGKHKGRLGKFITEGGGVGTGFNDNQRENIWALRDHLIGKTIEVEVTSQAPGGKFRHARFIRMRPDK